MTKFEAEAIKCKYGGAIANGGMFKRISTLPCSKVLIKYAYFVYIEAIIKDFGMLSKEEGTALVQCYSMMDLFIEDAEADRLNANFALSKDIKNFDDNVKYAPFKEAMTKHANLFINGEYFDEINEHIGACHKKYNIKK